MNFLVHSYLSGPSEDIIFGSLLGDKIKMNSYHKYNDETLKGILLGKKINEFVAVHPNYIKSQSRLNPKFRKSAKHILAIFNDHFLAKLWSDYSKISLSEYSEEICHLLLKRYTIMPYKLKLIYPLIDGSNWITNFATITGVHSTMRQLISIGVFRANIEYSIADLIEKYEQFKEDFLVLFSDLIKYVKDLSLMDIRSSGSEDIELYPVLGQRHILLQSRIPDLYKIRVG